MLQAILGVWNFWVTLSFHLFSAVTMNSVSRRDKGAISYKLFTQYGRRVATLWYVPQAAKLVLLPPLFPTTRLWSACLWVASCRVTWVRWSLPGGPSGVVGGMTPTDTQGDICSTAGIVWLLGWKHHATTTRKLRYFKVWSSGSFSFLSRFLTFVFILRLMTFLFIMFCHIALLINF